MKQDLKPLIVYLLKLGALFSILYFGTLAVIGLASPENYYSEFVDKYLNFIDPLRSFLLISAQGLLSVFGQPTLLADEYTLRVPEGGGVRMVYSCIGYGVMSFWAAFVLANRGSAKKKATWLFTGLLGLCAINILRIALLVVAQDRVWSMPLGFDHHTWFNIAAYGLIFVLIYLYDRSFQNTERGLDLKTSATHHS